MCVCVRRGHTCHHACVELRGQLAGVSSLLAPCGTQGWNSVIRLGGSTFSPEPAHWPLIMVKSLLQRVRSTVRLVLTRLSRNGGGRAPRSEVFLAWISVFISEVPQLKKRQTPQGHNCIHLHLTLFPSRPELTHARSDPSSHSLAHPLSRSHLGLLSCFSRHTYHTSKPCICVHAHKSLHTRVYLYSC